MKKQFLLLALAVACTSAFAGTAAEQAAATKELSSSDVKTELMGFDTVSYGGQEIRIAVTKVSAPNRGAYAYCRQYVQSYSHEIAPSDGQGGSGGALSADKTTIVLGNACQWTKG
jgi:hypothetical protein